AHLREIRSVYGARCAAMQDALARHLPAGTRWTRPDGGLFIWVRLPSGLRAEDLLVAALADKVAFVPGSPFFAREPQHEFCRLNFSNRPVKLIEVGMERLGGAVRTALRRMEELPTASA